MTKCGWIRFDRCSATLTVALMVLTAALMSESQAQVRQSLKIKLNVSPSVSVAGMGVDVQRALADEMPHLTEMFRGRVSGSDSIRFGSGFSISAYENTTVLISFTTPGQVGQKSNDSRAMRIMCGYLNDGTTYFRRATITDESPIEFRLRNTSLLKRSMQVNNPLFEAYVFFLVNQRKEVAGNESLLPVSTVTVELL